jgi:hypothetical protein
VEARRALEETEASHAAALEQALATAWAETEARLETIRAEVGAMELEKAAMGRKVAEGATLLMAEEEEREARWSAEAERRLEEAEARWSEQARLREED